MVSLLIYMKLHLVIHKSEGARTRGAQKSFSLKIIIQFMMEFKWVAYGLITLIVRMELED